MLIPNYKPDFTPAIFFNVLEGQDADDPEAWLEEQFNRGIRHIVKFYDPMCESDISAIRHTLDIEFQEQLESAIHNKLFHGGRVEIATASKHGNPHNPADMRIPVSSCDDEAFMSFQQSTLAWIYYTAATPRIWILNGSKSPEGKDLADHGAATVDLANHQRRSAITVGSEAYGLDADGGWNYPLLCGCPLLATMGYINKRDPNQELVVPDGFEVHAVLRDFTPNLDKLTLEEQIQSLRKRGFIVSSGSRGYDRFINTGMERPVEMATKR